MREIEINLIRGCIVKGLMKPLLVVKRKPAAEPLTKLGPGFKRPQVQVMILGCPPQPLDEDIVLRKPLAGRAELKCCYEARNCLK